MHTFKIESQHGAEHPESAAARAQNPDRIGSARDFWNYLLQLVSLGIFFGLGFALTLAAPGLRFLLGKRRSRALGAVIMQRGFLLYSWWLRTAGLFRITFAGAEDLSRLRGTIVAPNHPGLLDAVFLLGHLPRAVCVMRASLMRNPSFSGAAQLAGFITNDRGPGLIRQCREKLSAGDNLLIFPEGTRTRQYANGVNSFKHGFALAAVLTGAPIQTVFIERSGRYLGKEIKLLTAAKVPIEIRIVLGKTFRAAPGESAKDLSQRLEAYFRAQLVNTGSGIALARETTSLAGSGPSPSR